MKNYIKKIIYIIFSYILLNSCSPRTNIIDFDPSTLPKPKKIKITEKEKKESINILEKDYISNLKPLKDRDQILSKFKYGKKDPFSESDVQLNKLSSDLKLTGFINTEFEKYVFVNYLGNEGTISEKSIGGVNTNLLPESAKVINIDTKRLELIINYENKNFIFEL